MAQYNSAIITNQGLILADKAIQGTASYEIKKVTGSTTDLNKLSEDEIKNLTTIPDDSKVGKLVDKFYGENDNISNISIVFDNKDLGQSYSLNSIGIWATNNKTKETILYAVITAAQSEFIPNFKEKVFMTFKLNVVLKIGNKANVTIILDNSSNATIGYVDKITKEYDVKLNELEKNINENLNDDNSPINQKISKLQTDKASKDDLNNAKKELQTDINHKVDDNQDNTITVNKKVLTPVDENDFTNKLNDLKNNTVKFQAFNSSNINITSYFETGIYRTHAYSNILGLPKGAYEYGYLLNVHTESDIWQYYNDSLGNSYQRICSNGNWKDWIQTQYANSIDMKKYVDTTLAQQKEVILDLNRPKLTTNPEYDSTVNPDQWFYEEL